MSYESDAKSVSILWAAPERAPELAALHAELFTPGWDIASFERLLVHEGSTAFIARVGRPVETVGFILGQLAADEVEILTLGVRSNWQRRGIGRLLVEALGRAARNAEAKRLILEVGENNGAALALYRRLGFAATGRRKGYYTRRHSASEDALTLERVLR
jgi:[ribosomal protein S18]-alanine N-acetyltransferase